MADNRMVVVCRKCKLGIAIAKYYLGSGWGQYPLNEDRLNAFFVKHRHDFDEGTWGGHQYYLGYEDCGEWQYDDVEVEG